MVGENLRPVLGVTQWPWAEASPCNISSALSVHSHAPHSHPRLRPRLHIASVPQPGPGCRPGLQHKLLELEGLSRVPPNFESGCFFV